MPQYLQSTGRSLKTISAVIPTLNESAHIAGAVQSLQGQEGLLEILVVDGGSSDGTRGIAEDLGVRVIQGPKGRGHQIREGVAQSLGDVILVLHGDCRVKPGVFRRILKQLNGNPGTTGGALGMEYSASTCRTRFLSRLNNARARHLGISFGDQCQFFTRAALHSCGGFPDQMLMEDIELSLRLQSAGTLCFLPHGVVASHRRWKEKGFIKNFLRVTSLSLAYLVMRRFKGGEAIAADFYTRYYRNR